MDRILFGDNQFFGVNHMSEEKARAQSMMFRDTESIVRVLDVAYDLGLKTFMCTTHDRIADVCDHFRANRSRYSDYEFYPGMPYAHKYANAVTELGMMGALKKFVPGSMLDAFVRGGKALATRDTIGMMKLAVDAEMKMFHDLRTPVIFLQNVLFDMLLGLDLKDIVAGFAEHVRERYDAEPGFFTMNLPRSLTFLAACGIENPIVCSSINKIGFRMSGGLEEYERVIATQKFRPIAMSVFASGAIPPSEALEYVCRQEKIESIVFGASSRSHITQTIEMINRFSGAPARR